MLVHAYNFSTEKAEGGRYQIQGQPSCEARLCHQETIETIREEGLQREE